CAIEHSSGDVF
nr:immunoglobulin light chain junction region [Macaca mulatta]MPN69193.1 immunoglobulin light chain junction region [Macaca mulatta]